MLQEHLTKALHSMEFARGSLRDALTECGAVEAIVILAQIEKAEVLRREVWGLLDAVKGDNANANELL